MSVLDTGQGTQPQGSATESVTGTPAAVPGDWASVVGDPEVRPPESGQTEEEATPDGALTGGLEEAADPLDGAMPTPEEPETETGGDADGAGYEDLRLPEGYIANEERMAGFTALLGEGKVDKAVAQKMLDFHLQDLERHDREMVEYLHGERARIDREWMKAIRADPEVGGQNFAQSVNLAQRGMRHFVRDAEEMKELVSLYNDANIRNCPVLLKLWKRVGEHVGEAEAFSGESDSKARGGADARDFFPDVKG